MKQRNIKIIIVFLIIIIIYAGIIIILNRNKKIEKDDSVILLFSENDIVEYKDNNLVKVDKINEDLEYIVYINNDYFGEYKVVNNNGFKLYKNNSLVDYEGLFFAYTDNVNIKSKKIIRDEINASDLLRINRIMDSNSTLNDFFVKEKCLVDLDNNGVNDQIINVSNLIGYVETEKYFNLVYVILNNDIELVLIKDIVSPKDVLVYPSYYIYSIFNINNSHNDYITIQKRYFSLGGEPNVMIYEYINNQYSKIIN